MQIKKIIAYSPFPIASFRFFVQNSQTSILVLSPESFADQNPFVFLRLILRGRGLRTQDSGLISMNTLFRKKSIAQIQADAAAGMSDHAAGVDGGGLRRSLGTFDLTMLGIAAIIGAGIFAMVGQASFDGGPAVILLFIFAAVACGFSALCYAEFASKIPIAGSAYTYAYASFGELLAWIIGWDLLVEYAIGNIAVAISWSGYFVGLLSSVKIPSLGIPDGINIPLHFTMDYRTASLGYETVNQAIGKGATLQSLQAVCKNTGAAIGCDKIDAYTAWLSAPHIGGFPIIANLPTLGIVFIITCLVYIGIRESKTASNIMVGIKLAIILLVIVLGAFYVKPSNWSPFMPKGFSGVMSGVAAVFFAYIGFDALSTTAEECKDPYKTLPRGMIYSLVICTVLYVVLALVLTGMVNYSLLNVPDPLAFVFGDKGVNIPWVSGVIAVSAVIALATVLLVFQLGQPRLWMAMSRDGLLPKIFSSIHPKFRTPWFSTILTGFMVAIPALFMNLTEVTDLSVIGTLFAFTIVCAGRFGQRQGICRTETLRSLYQFAMDRAVFIHRDGSCNHTFQRRCGGQVFYRLYACRRPNGTRCHRF